MRDLAVRTAVNVAQQGAKTKEGQTKDNPYFGKKIRAGYKDGERIHTFDRDPAVPLAESFSFSGKGFLPNVMNSHALVTLPEASATTLEHEGVHGREGMMPPAGRLGKLQPGQGCDEGAGGAGSFATVVAFGAKQGG
jgi:hypothetical protein